MWSLLRRIVVPGVATAEQKAKVARLLQEWEDAKKSVEEVQKKIDRLIAELQSMESETANVAQKNVSMVKEKVNAVHKANNVIDVNKAKVTKAVNDAKETVKKSNKPPKASRASRSCPNRKYLILSALLTSLYCIKIVDITSGTKSQQAGKICLCSLL